MNGEAMQELADWLATHAAGRSYLQLGGLGNPGLAHVPQALRAGAASAIQMEPVPRPAEAWAALQAACAPHGQRFTAMTQDPCDPHALARRLGFIDAIHVTQLFHERDPYLLLARLDRHARRHLIVTSVVIPEGLAEGDAVAGYSPDDPRLAAVRQVLEARGVALDQFARPPDHIAPNGIATWEGMWNWFHTEAALRRLVGHFGWRVSHAFRSWGDLGLTLVAERAGEGEQP